MTSRFVYEVTSVYPILRLGLIHKLSIDSRSLKWSVQVNVLLNNCKQNITALSLLVGKAVHTSRQADRKKTITVIILHTSGLCSYFGHCM